MGSEGYWSPSVPRVETITLRCLKVTYVSGRFRNKGKVFLSLTRPSRGRGRRTDFLPGLWVSMSLTELTPCFDVRFPPIRKTHSLRVGGTCCVIHSFTLEKKRCRREPTQGRRRTPYVRTSDHLHVHGQHPHETDYT